MGYEIYTDHPESEKRRAENFTSWMYWAKANAPWTGVGIDEMAEILSAVCADPAQAASCQILDEGGTLDPDATSAVLRAAEGRMSARTRVVFAAARKGGYGVRVVFSQGAFGKAVSASAYLEKFGSATEH